MKIYLASDHAGYNLKEQVKVSYKDTHELIDLGPTSTESVDYPDFANLVADELEKNPDAFGVLICGSGQGMAMRANKFPHIRAALCWSKEVVELSRQHNDANVLCLGARLLPAGTIFEIIDRFLATAFEGGRHSRRVDKISQSTT